MKWWAHLAQLKSSVHGNVYRYSGNVGLSTQVPTASSRQAVPAPMDREGLAEAGSKANQGPQPGLSFIQQQRHLTRLREENEDEDDPSRTSRTPWPGRGE